MDRCNISQPKPYSYERTLIAENAKLMAELDVVRSHLREAEDQLESIFNNVREGNECWLDYTSGERLWIGQVPSPRDEPVDN
ncbi:MAG: hypothetical protein AAGD43_26185 [Pseudomonadota bacterium]